MSRDEKNGWSRVLASVPNVLATWTTPGNFLWICTLPSTPDFGFSELISIVPRHHQGRKYGPRAGKGLLFLPVISVLAFRRCCFSEAFGRAVTAERAEGDESGGLRTARPHCRPHARGRSCALPQCTPTRSPATGARAPSSKLCTWSSTPDRLDMSGAANRTDTPSIAWV